MCSVWPRWTWTRRAPASGLPLRRRGDRLRGRSGRRRRSGDTVAVSAAAGGVGSVAVQLLKVRGAEVIAATYPLDEVRAAYELLEQRHTLGKIVLLP